MVLNRNPDNFFAETEQVAFCTAHIVPGLDFSNDPLLAGRIHSYVDTQISRLGGPNFHEIPINAPVAQVHNNQRDGMHRQAIPRGRVAYEPNSLGGGCPFQAGARGFMSFPQTRNARTRCAASPRNSPSTTTRPRCSGTARVTVEKQHIIRAFRFELTKVQVLACDERVVAQLRNVAEELAQAVASGLGMTELPEPLPKVLKRAPRPEVARSEALSLLVRPGQVGIRSRRVALLVADGVDGDAAAHVHEALVAEGAVPRFVGVKMGQVQSAEGEPVEVEVSLEAAPSVLWDAAIFLEGETLAASGQALEFLKDQYRHCKPILLLDGASALLDKAGIPPALASGDSDPGLIRVDDSDLEEGMAAFVAALTQHRHFDRETDPPQV